jgi:hypothetical protein
MDNTQFTFELHVNDCVGPKQANKNSTANFQCSTAYYLAINPIPTCVHLLALAFNFDNFVTYKGKDIALLIFNFGARRWWVVSTTPRPLYLRERPGTHCTGGWLSPRAGLDVCEKSRPHRDSTTGPSSP